LIHDADGVSDAADADYYGAYAADDVDNYSVVAGGGKDSATGADDCSGAHGLESLL